MEDYGEFQREQKNVLRRNIQKLLNVNNIDSFHQLDIQQFNLILDKVNKSEDQDESSISDEEYPIISRNVLHQLGREDFNPTLGTLMKLAYLFDVSIADLFKEDS